MEAVRDSTLLDSALLRPFRAGTQSRVSRLPTDETADFVVDPTVVLGEGVLRLPQSVGGSGAVLLLEDLHWADPDTGLAGLSRRRAQHVAGGRSGDGTR